MLSGSPPSSSRKFAVIGGGIGGLTAAHQLTRRLPGVEISLFEASDRLGGPLFTHREDGKLLEQGADSFLAKDPDVVDLCRELRIDDELIGLNPDHRRALVLCRGRLEPIPAGFVLMQPRSLLSVLRSPILSSAGKLRLLGEPLIAPPPETNTPGYDESVRSFALRRLGREAFERLVRPLVEGIYVGDAAELSMAATMPQFLEAERSFCSLWKAARKNKEESQSRGARYNAFLTLKHGTSVLVNALASALPEAAVRVGTRVERISQLADSRWRVEAPGHSMPAFDGVVVATPAPSAAQLLSSLDQTLAGMVGQITCASSVVVTLVYAKSQLGSSLDSFGFVVPRIERRSIIAASFPSVKFPDQGSIDLVPIRVFLGGIQQPELVDLPDEEVLDIAARELAQLLNIRGGPQRSLVARWRQAMPQYRVGHQQLIAKIQQTASLYPGLALAGSAYHGVGIPQCVRSGRAAAERIVSALEGSSGC